MGGWVVRQSPHIRITLVAWALKPRKHWTVGVFERITLPNLINMVRVYIVWNAWPCKTLQMNCLRNVLCTWFRIRIIKNMFSKNSICLIDLPQSFVVLIQMWPARHEFNRKDSMNTCQCFNTLIRSHVSRHQYANKSLVKIKAFWPQAGSSDPATSYVLGGRVGMVKSNCGWWRVLYLFLKYIYPLPARILYRSNHLLGRRIVKNNREVLQKSKKYFPCSVWSIFIFASHAP